MQDLVKLHEDKAVTTTLKVADFFGKDHRKVIRDLKLLLEQGSEAGDTANFGRISSANSNTGTSTALNFERCASDQNFFESNFKEMTYLDSANREQVSYEMTKSGFALLAMGFTGPKALQFKIGYINAFDEMESKLKQKHIKELTRLGNIEDAWEKSERSVTELSHKINNDHGSLLAEVKNLKLAVVEERKDVRDQLIDLKAEKQFGVWKKQLGKVWSKRFSVISENLQAIERRLVKLHEFQDPDIDRAINRIKHELDANTPD